MINKKHSYKDYTGQDLSKLPAAEFSNSTIKGTCFSQELIKSDDLVNVFPEGVENITFERCNLDNVLIPKKCDKTKCCTNKMFKVQADKRDWVIDPVTKEPIEPLNKKLYLKKGWSIDPKDIEKDKDKRK